MKQPNYSIIVKKEYSLLIYFRFLGFLYNEILLMQWTIIAATCMTMVVVRRT